MPKKKFRIHSETVYILSVLILSFAVAMASCADMGLSMIVAPAYILSQKLKFLTFGQCEYVLQGVLFLSVCLLMKRIRLSYFFSFVTCLFYGAVLDFWRWIIPLFNPSVTAPGSVAMGARIPLFLCSVVLTSFSVSLVFRTYLCPQVCDFFVKAISKHFKLDRHRTKMIFDICIFSVGLIMTLVFFGKVVGIGIGTLIIVLVNSHLINWFGKLFDRRFEVVPYFPHFAEKFDL